MTEPDQDRVPISKASQITGLPESTIRYYDREFSEYLSIPRGSNNQRLFDRQNMDDLEYIRYLIKRENLSVEEVRERLRREASFQESTDSGSPSPEPSTRDGSDQGEDSDHLRTWLEQIDSRLSTLEARLDDLEEGQQKISRLLDMNLQRYNQIVEDL